MAIRQTAGHVGSKIERKRRTADLRATIDELIAVRSAGDKSCRVPDTGKVRLPVCHARRGAGQVRTTISLFGHTRRWIMQPLTQADEGRSAEKENKNGSARGRDHGCP